jgi:hypothetical protein
MRKAMLSPWTLQQNWTAFDCLIATALHVNTSLYFMFLMCHLKTFSEHWWNDSDRGKPKYCEKNLSQCDSAHRPVTKPSGPRHSQQPHDTEGSVQRRHCNVAKVKLFSEVFPITAPNSSKQQKFRFVSTWPTCATVAPVLRRARCLLCY